MAPLSVAVSSQLAVSLLSSLLVSDPEKNIVVSPLSISSALSLVAAGAKGETLKQIVDVFKWKENADNLARKLLTEAEKAKSECGVPCIVKLANNIWLDNQFDVLESYHDLLKMFAVNVEKADFRENSVKETTRINSWIEKNTNGKIANLFPPGQINEETLAVLVNALYFKGKWMEPFDIDLTKEAPFHISNVKRVSTKMMYHSGKLKYHMDEARKCDILELPYSSKGFSMIIVVPHEIEGLYGIQSALSMSVVSEWINSVRSSVPETVDVFLPRFKISHKIDLKKVLKGLGINDMFSRHANLTGITQSVGIFVSSAVHQAVIEVNEDGTEAAAATGFGVNFMSMPPQITADKPFLFLITSNVTNNIFFIGKVADPTN